MTEVIDCQTKTASLGRLGPKVTQSPDAAPRLLPSLNRGDAPPTADGKNVRSFGAKRELHFFLD
jgi:hypothetical protein